MQVNSLIENKSYNSLYNYYRRHGVSEWIENFILILLSVVIGATITVGIPIIYKLLDKQSFSNLERSIQFLIFIVVVIITRILIGIVRRSSELKMLKKREKIYAKTFIKLHNEYVKARKEIKDRDEFLLIATHELKTPLTSMLLKLENMINNVRNVSLANFSVKELMMVLENAEQQVKSLSMMINNLLNVSLITTGKMNLDRKNFDLVAVTKRVKENFSEVLLRNNYQIKINAKSPVVGYWDKARIEEVITNLFSNAIKYGENKPVEISIVNSGSIGKFIIKDQGVGIPQEKQKMLFDRFTRASPNNGEIKGLGVGLYIANQIVKVHNGRIKLFSLPKKGSTFTVELPLKG